MAKGTQADHPDTAVGHQPGLGDEFAFGTALEEVGDEDHDRPGRLPDQFVGVDQGLGDVGP